MIRNALSSFKFSIKANLALLAVGLVWLTLICLMLPLMFVAYIYDRQKRRAINERWLYSILIAQDILVNCILGGYFRTTISSEVGNLQRQGSETGRQIAALIDWGFYAAVKQINHCSVSIELEDKHLVTAPKACAGFASYMAALTAIIYF